MCGNFRDHATARSEFDTVVGLDSGADDYIPKPFRMMNDLRVRALFGDQRTMAQRSIVWKNLYVCPGRHEVTVDQEPESLKEYEMLSSLLKNSGAGSFRTQL